MKSIAARKSKIGNRLEPKPRIEEPETVDLEKAFSAARGFFSQIKKHVSKKKEPVFNKVKVNCLLSDFQIAENEKRNFSEPLFL